MKEEILQLIEIYWIFNEKRKSISDWDDKQNLLKAINELTEDKCYTGKDMDDAYDIGFEYGRVTEKIYNMDC